MQFDQLDILPVLLKSSIIFERLCDVVYYSKPFITRYVVIIFLSATLYHYISY
ncbi:hypothetical protein RUND412_005559, partial [Rhizina undulata]